MDTVITPCWPRAPRIVRGSQRRAGAGTGVPGFTMLEITIGILLLGLAMALVSTSMGSLTSAQLREAMTHLQGLTRDTYARTALTGDSHRIVFDFDGNAFWVERTDGVARLRAEKQETTADGAGLLDVLDSRVEGLEDSDDLEDKEKLRLFGGPTWQPVEDEGGKPYVLPSGCRIWSFWADHLDERVTAGKAALHFFPGGYTQEAHISVTDDDTGSYVLTLVTNPLTGETYIEDKVLDPP